MDSLTSLPNDLLCHLINFLLFSDIVKLLLVNRSLYHDISSMKGQKILLDRKIVHSSSLLKDNYILVVDAGISWHLYMEFPELRKKYFRSKFI